VRAPVAPEAAVPLPAPRAAAANSVNEPVLTSTG
jgi:hypothetical protein